METEETGTEPRGHPGAVERIRSLPNQPWVRGVREVLDPEVGVRVVRATGARLAHAAPHVLAATTFLAGALLLLTGALPTDGSRLARAAEVLPLPVIEVGHFLGSLVGVGLLVLARGLQQRLKAAYYLAAALLAVGAALALLRGLDVEAAVGLLALLAVMAPARRHFYRRASLTAEWFTPGWVAAIALVLAGTAWLTLVSVQSAEAARSLWWRFALDGDAPRALRASVGAIGAALAVAATRLLRPAPPKPTTPGAEDLERARAIIEASPRTDANLAYLGDKRLLFSDEAPGFVMYAVEGRSWVSKGDPVGAPEALPGLVWRFVDLARRHGGWPVFYQVDADNLHLYLDAGLTLLKLGEVARVPLEGFSLQGRARKPLRNACSRVEREGCAFEVVPPEGVEALLPELQRVSAAWMAGKRAREKGFSLGRFDAAYLRRFPVGVVRRDGRVVAFGNVWRGGEGGEVSVDLMRYDPAEAPPGVMEYLFAQLMLWGAAEGYAWFNLGVAPLSGLENRPKAPAWNRVGALLYRHGDHFYNYQGLRAFKEKFHPRWTPTYLACPGGMQLPAVLTNVASLIGGGLKGVVGK